MAHWSGWHLGTGKVSLKNVKHSHLWCHPQRTPNSDKEIFFSIKTRKLHESVEGLNSSLALAAGKCGQKNGPLRL